VGISLLDFAGRSTREFFEKISDGVTEMQDDV
jgi:hypothetical protein